MAIVYVFADEAGDFVFKRTPGASRYFILGTGTMADYAVGDQLLKLRRSLALDHFPLRASQCPAPCPRTAGRGSPGRTLALR
jgi:hypothetical protein